MQAAAAQSLLPSAGIVPGMLPTIVSLINSVTKVVQSFTLKKIICTAYAKLYMQVYMYIIIIAVSLNDLLATICYLLFGLKLIILFIFQKLFLYAVYNMVWGGGGDSEIFKITLYTKPRRIWLSNSSDSDYNHRLCKVRRQQIFANFKQQIKLVRCIRTYWYTAYEMINICSNGNPNGFWNIKLFF